MISKEEISLIQQLRYNYSADGTIVPDQYRHTIKQIGALLRLSDSQVQYRLQINDRPDTPKISPITASARKILTDEKTLHQTASLSIDERKNLFNQSRPNKKPITKANLRQLYAQEKIRFKKVITAKRFRRNVTPAVVVRDHAIFVKLQLAIRRAIRFGIEVVMIDESTFSQWSYHRLAWAKPYQNVSTTTYWAPQDPIACCAAVSKQRGLICHSMVPFAFNKWSFLSFLKKLRQNIDPSKTLLLLDNCSIHQAKEVKDYIAYAKLNVVFNVPYSPQYNGIELVWAQVKRLFRQRITQIRTNQRQPRTLKAIVRQCLTNVPEHTIKKCCNHSLQLVMKEE